MAITVKVGARRPTSLNLIDTHWLFRVIENLKTAEGRTVSLNYRELLRVLADYRRANGFGVADESIAPAAVDPRSESQQRFVEALRQIGLVVDPVDYRTTFVSHLPQDERGDRPAASLGQYLSYVMGLVANRTNPEIVVVTGAFDVYLPLLDFANRRGGKAAVAFFRRYLDPRWVEIARLGERDGVVPFIDLEPMAEALLGFNLRSMSPDPEQVLAGLGRI